VTLLTFCEHCKDFTRFESLCKHKTHWVSRCKVCGKLTVHDMRNIVEHEKLFKHSKYPNREASK